MFDSVPLSVYILEVKPSVETKTKKKKQQQPVEVTPDPEATQKPKRKKPEAKKEEDGTIIARLDIHTDDDRKGKTTVIDRKGLAFLLDENDEDFEELLTLITSTDLWCGYDKTYWMKLPDGNTIEIGRFSHLKHAVKVARCYVGVMPLE